MMVAIMISATLGVGMAFFQGRTRLQMIFHGEGNSANPGLMFSRESTSTVMTIPAFLRMMSPGRLFMTPPSTCTTPSCRTGTMMPGRDELVRAAAQTGPSWCTFSSQEPRFEETQKKLSQRSSIRASP